MPSCSDVERDGLNAEPWYNASMNTHRPNNRKIARKVDLNEEDGTLTPQGSSAAERLLMVWRITQDCWAFVPGHDAKREFQRHVTCVERRGR